MDHRCLRHGGREGGYEALLTSRFPDPVAVRLPRGLRATFALAETRLSDGTAHAAVVKDAGDDPDVPPQVRERIGDIVEDTDLSRYIL